MDGFSHWNNEAKNEDAQREKVLLLAWFTVLRFTDEEVLNNLAQVQEKIERWIDEKKSPFRNVFNVLPHVALWLHSIVLPIDQPR